MDSFAAHRIFATGLDMVDVSERDSACLVMIDRRHANVCPAALATQCAALRAALSEVASEGAADGTIIPVA